MHSWNSMPEEIPTSWKNKNINSFVEISLHPDLMPIAYAHEHSKTNISIFFRYLSANVENKKLLSIGSAQLEIGEKSKRVYAVKLSKYNRTISLPDFPDDELQSFIDHLISPLLTYL